MLIRFLYFLLVARIVLALGWIAAVAVAIVAGVGTWGFVMGCADWLAQHSYAGIR